MKAVICTKYGSVDGLEIRDVKKPKPQSNEVLIKIMATTAHIGDTKIRRADPFLVRLVFGIFKPRKNLILGMEISGVVEEVGKDVTSFKEGDEVFAFTGFSNLGGYAEYITLPAEPKKGKLEKRGLVVAKPENLSYAEAAAVPAGCLTALKNLEKAEVRQDQKILINGGSGSLGTYAIQLAKFYGAQVTAVCSGKNRELVKSIGADKVIDYTKKDFTEEDTKYDIVYDAVMKSKYSKCKKILKKGGRFLRNKGTSKIEKKDLIFLKDLIEKNIIKPVIDRSYSFDEIVEAHRYVDKGHKKGNVVIIVHDDK